MKAEDESGIFIGSPRKEDLADKILNMLAANAQRLERLESELIQIQIGGVSASPAVNYENDLKLLSQLPESMDFYFNSGSTWLSSGSLLQLNEIVEILAKAPSVKVVITGYADKTGDISISEPGYYGWIMDADFPRYTKQCLKKAMEKVKAEKKNKEDYSGDIDDKLNALKNKFK